MMINGGTWFLVVTIIIKPCFRFNPHYVYFNKQDNSILFKHAIHKAAYAQVTFLKPYLPSGGCKKYIY